MFCHFSGKFDFSRILQELCGRFKKILKNSTHMWKDVEDYEMWESDLESSIAILYIHVYTRMY